MLQLARRAHSQTLLGRSFSSQSESVRLAPAARSLLLRSNLALDSVVGTGKHGIVLKSDVLQFIAKGGSSSPKKDVAVKSQQATTPKTQAAGTNAAFEEIPNSTIRKIIAQRLTQSKSTIPHGYMTKTIRIDRLLSLRASINQGGKVKVSVNDFIIKASALALMSVPEVNSFWDVKKEEVTHYGHQADISVAVATDKGLITPIVKSAQYKPLPDISTEIQELAKRARENKLKPEEFQGGSFSVSNLGMFGINSFSAVINPPQGAILAIGGAIKVPSFNDINGDMMVGQEMTVTLSFDCRAIIEDDAAKFLDTFGSFLTNPHSLL